MMMFLLGFITAIVATIVAYILRKLCIHRSIMNTIAKEYPHFLVANA